MTVGELMIASDAMYHHFFDIEKKFAVISALRCDQAVLGIIGDFVIQVDIVLVCFAYTSVNGGYQISVRTIRFRREIWLLMSARESVPAADTQKRPGEGFQKSFLRKNTGK